MQVVISKRGKFFKSSKPSNNTHILIIPKFDGHEHGLRTPNEGINQKNLKIWADVADKTCFGCT